MKILAFSDWRSQSFEMLERIVHQEKPDSILYAGDDLERILPIGENILLDFGRKKITINKDDLFSKDYKNEIFTSPALMLLKEIIKRADNRKSIKDFNIPYFYIYGNDDEIKKYKKLFFMPLIDNSFPTDKIDTKYLYIKKDKKIGVLSISSDLTYHSKEPSIYFQIHPTINKTEVNISSEKFTIAGTSCTYGVPTEVVEHPFEHSDILLTHIPPIGILDLSKRFGNGHIGSKIIRKVIVNFSPKIVICGHSHIWGGESRKLEGTDIINVSSNDHKHADGNYAIINSKNWSYEIKKISGKKMQSIAGFRDIVKLIHEEWRLGKDFPEFSQFPPDKDSEFIKILEELEIRGHTYAETVRKRVESKQWDRPKIIRKVSFEPTKQAYVDVETGAATGNKTGKLWLIGILYNKKITHFKIPKETKIFLQYLKDNDIYSLASWTSYDQKAIEPILQNASIKIKFIDACSRVRRCIIWHTYKLEPLYKALVDTTYQSTSISGRAAGLYADHLIIPNAKCKYCPAPNTIDESIRTKNAHDLQQMQAICQATHEPQKESSADPTKVTY